MGTSSRRVLRTFADNCQRSFARQDPERRSMRAEGSVTRIGDTGKRSRGAGGKAVSIADFKLEGNLQSEIRNRKLGAEGGRRKARETANGGRGPLRCWQQPHPFPSDLQRGRHGPGDGGALPAGHTCRAIMVRSGSSGDANQCVGGCLRRSAFGGESRRSRLRSPRS